MTWSCARLLLTWSCARLLLTWSCARLRQSILLMEEQQPYVQVPHDVCQAVVIQSATLAWDDPSAGTTGEAATAAAAPGTK